MTRRLLLVTTGVAVLAGVLHRLQIPSPGLGGQSAAAAVSDTSPALDQVRAPTINTSPAQRSPAWALAPGETDPDQDTGYPDRPARPQERPPVPTPPGSARIEQTTQGTAPPAAIVASFDGLGVGFGGSQEAPVLHNPSDNSLAVGPDHIVQIVNSRMAVFSKKGARFDSTGTVLYGPAPTNTLFRGFTGGCERFNSGDAVARYDQLADRWLIVMPIFARSPRRTTEPTAPRPGKAERTTPGVPDQPGDPRPLDVKPAAAPTAPRANGAPAEQGSFGLCYAVSATPDPLGAYYRYEFVRPLFPDYPRPAIWPDGYYVPTSTGDDVIQKHACVADRSAMLRGARATEQCVVIDSVNFLNNADLDGTTLPPPGAPNIMMAAGGTQLLGKMEDDGIYVWSFHVDWAHPSRTRVRGPQKINVAPYHYLCDGQLTRCVTQPGTDRQLDAQGDKLMARLVYRRIGNRESIVAVHSVTTAAGGGGIRWYEFRVGGSRRVSLFQQGTYAPDRWFRWLGSPAIDRLGNIGIGYSFGGGPNYPGQRFAGRRAGDRLGVLPLGETTLAVGEAAQTTTLRWEDYTQTAMDPTDDCTIWYVGDYFKAEAASYSTRIGGFQMPGCS